MKTSTGFLAALILLALQAAAVAQRATQEELIQRKEKKYGKAFLKKTDWVTDYDEARKRAKKEGKLILAYFTRSYYK